MHMMTMQKRLPPSDLLNWDDLQLTLAVARAGSLTGAARALLITQPTAGRRLAGFEAKLGFPLFSRTPAGLEATTLGRQLLETLTSMESAALAFQRQAAATEQREELLSIACLDWVANAIVGPIAGKFCRDHHWISVELRTGYRKASLSRGEADIAVRFTRFEQLDLVQRKVGSLSSRLYASKEYLTARGLPDPSNGFTGHTLATMPAGARHIEDYQWLLELASNARIAFRSNNLDAIARAAEAGAGIAVLPEIIGSTAKLVVIDVPMPIPMRSLWVGYHQDLRRSERVSRFVQFLCQEMQPRSVGR